MITLLVAPLDHYGFEQPAPKDPDATAVYGFDWSRWLADVADEVVSFEVTGTDGLAVQWSAFDGSLVTARAEGGTAGTKARLRCRVTTRLGRVDTRSISLRIVDR